MKPIYLILLLVSLVCMCPYLSFSQTPTLEFTSGASNPTTAQGPVVSQAITFQNNTDNPTGNTFAAFSTPTTTATFSFGNYQYYLLSTQTTDPTLSPLMFGATNSSTSQAAPVNIYNVMSTVGSASDADFTSASTVTAGTGITQAINEAVYVYTSAMGMYNANLSTTGRYYIGDLTITFNANVTNPVLHLVGLGAADGALGLTTELELQTPSVTLSVLSGSTELTVSSGTKILNGAANPGAVTGSGAASGSVLVTGANITSLVFQVYLRANGGAASWTTGPHVGDAWMIGISTPASLVTPLSLAITSFTTTAQGLTAQLQWQAETDDDSRFFDIESNVGGKAWQSIGMIMAADNSNTLYRYTDVNPMAGVNYYRIKEVDINGNAVYSSVSTIDFGKNPQTKVFPNPVRDKLYITGNSGAVQSVVISNTEGKEVFQFNNPVSESSLDMSHLVTGIYFVTIRHASGQMEITKIFKN